MKGLSFNEPMVKAWLEGRKLVTRRLMKPQPTGHPWGYNPSHRLEHMMLLTNKGWYCKFWHQIAQNPLPDGEQWIRAPYQPGETVYIKETWRVGAWGEHDNMIAVDYKADGYCRKEWIFLGFTDDADRQFCELWRQSTDDAEKVYGRQEKYKWEPGQSPCRWRSPRFMPEWASRSHAMIVSVRPPERIREITPEEVKKEGLIVQDFAGINVLALLGLTPKTYMEEIAIMEFQSLWDTLHPGSWGRNDWVWPIELEKQ